MLSKPIDRLGSEGENRNSSGAGLSMSENKESSAAKTALAERPRIAAQVRKRKLGEVLQERGHVSQHNLTRAVQEQAGKTVLLGELLLGRGLVSKDDLVAALEQVTGLRYVDCGSATVHDNVLKFVPRRVADRYCALPLSLSREGITDRKSTRLNSSHLVISYAVFCLKKKKKNRIYTDNMLS